MTRSILIAGCGDVGIAFGQLQVERGHEVWGLRRNVTALPQTFRGVAADLTRVTAEDLPAIIDTVVYAAAADERSEAAYERAYVKGVEQLGVALEPYRSSIERFVFVSSTGVYAQNAGEVVTEDSPTEPTVFTGQQVLAGERQVRELGYPSIVARAGGIYGPGRTALIERVRSGGGVPEEHPPYFTNRIHRDDLARGLDHLVELAQPAPTYLMTDNDSAARSDVHRWIAAKLGVTRFASPGDPPTGRSKLKPPSGLGKRCSNQRLRDSGFQLRYPTFREGYAELLK